MIAGDDIIGDARVRSALSCYHLSIQMRHWPKIRQVEFTEFLMRWNSRPRQFEASRVHRILMRWNSRPRQFGLERIPAPTLSTPGSRIRYALIEFPENDS
jgi:hypothetical protein